MTSSKKHDVSKERKVKLAGRLTIIKSKCRLVALVIIFVYLNSFSTLKSQDILTRGEVYDFEIGDIFHFRLEYSDGGMGGETHILNFEITDKYYSTTGDSLIYARDNQKKIITSEYPVWVYYYYSDTFIIDNLDGLIHNGEINHVYSDPYMYNGRTINKYSWDNEWNHGYDMYAEGCGSTADYLANNDGSGAYSQKDLVYYKKGEEEWGAPLIVSLNENEYNDSKFSLYPNPVYKTIHITPSSDIEEVFIINNSGQILIRSTKSEIDVSSLTGGIYIVEIKVNSNFVKKKLM
jgi:hypothetical protein